MLLFTPKTLRSGEESWSAGRGGPGPAVQAEQGYQGEEDQAAGGGAQARGILAETTLHPFFI